jgi:rfaE bifunctional protein kinase chain/domain
MQTGSHVKIATDRIDHLTRAFRGKRIAIVGDLMVDRYYWGKVTRVSPEAPVPVVDVTSESARLGGAANVANNIQSLGGDPLLVGVVGDDHVGGILSDLMKEQRLDAGGIVVEAGRRTTVKTRVIAHDQHVVRIDYETRVPCPEFTERRIIDVIRGRIEELDAIILEDYNKGVMTRNVITSVIEVARAHRRAVLVDPKFENFFEYKNVTLFKPNRRETEEVLGGRIRTSEDLHAAGKRMLRELAAENVLLTRGEEGMSLFESDGTVTHLKTTARHVKDVSGAGDTVIATLTMALAAGAAMREAAVLANEAGGVVVGSVGIVPITVEQLVEAATLTAGNDRRVT